MLDKQTRWGIVLYKELGRLTGGLIPEFQADLDAMQHGLGFTDHACDVVPLLINCHKQYKKISHRIEFKYKYRSKHGKLIRFNK